MFVVNGSILKKTKISKINLFTFCYYDPKV